MPARKYLRGGLLLTGGSVLSAACSFARNIIIARLISVEDFGIASTFAMTMSLIEMASNLALDRLLVQAPDGDAPRMLATAHAFQAFRGAVTALVLFLVAGPVAAAFEIPDVAWAFRIIALTPLIKGLGHLDSARLQREMRFGAAVWLDAAPQVVTTAAAAPLALWLNDYRVMLLVVLIQVLTMTLVSHLVAERPYRWAWDVGIIRRMLRFGWPLLINGLLMFMIFQGDKAIVGVAFSMRELGWFSAAFGLTLLPAMIVPKVIATLLFPSLSRAHIRGNVRRHSRFVIEAFSYSAMLFAIFFWLFGPIVFITVYGLQYAPGASIVTVLGVGQAIRILKAGHVTVALSAGRTQVILWSNAMRIIGLALAIISAAAGYGILAIVISGVAGEFLALAVIIGYATRFGISLRDAAGPPLAAILATMLLISAYETMHHLYHLESYMALLTKAAILSLSLPLLLAFPTVRSELLRKWRSPAPPAPA